MFLYRPTLRPAGFATLPAGVRWQFHELPSDDYSERDLPRSRWRYGVIETDRELTAKECDTFDLVKV